MNKNYQEVAPWILGDGHVHIHECYQVPRLFESALNNFHALQNDMPHQGKAECFLFLTESSGADWFSRWQTSTGKVQTAIEGFTITLTNDSNCLLLKKQGGDSLFIVAGRQIVTAESLEVLALGLDEPYPDGKPIRDVLQDLAGLNCLRVVPWGAGKWLGKRGEIIRDIISNWEEDPLFLGDNGNRPYFWPLPSIFSMARQNSIHNLPGSDPLPFADQEDQVGSYGFFLAGAIDSSIPFSSLRKRIMENMTAITPYGKTERLVPFIRHQVAMQLCKKKKY